jgi:D-alanyl-D-alanine carboxypeptidase
VAKAAETNRTEAPKLAMPPQPANHGTGQGILGVLPASSLTQGTPQASPSQALAYADPAPHAQPPAVQQQALQPQAVQQNGAIKPAATAVARTGWIIQVGALESESEAKQRIDLARNKASSLLSKADPFTEPVVSKDNRTLFRARFAGLERDQAEAVCRALKRADISCITVRN